MNITQAAIDQVKSILASEPEGSRLRLAVQGGGCSGFQYGFSIDTPQDDDLEFEDVVLIDMMSLQYLNEATVDFKTTLEGSSFTISNPAAKTTCGCGSSFSA